MNGSYHEFHPSPRLAPYIECYWSFRATSRIAAHVVLPDGCTDLLIANSSTSTSNDVIGLMTRPGEFSINSNDHFFGVRFHPGMANAFLRAPGKEFKDATTPLTEIWGSRATDLTEQILETSSDQARVAILESAFVELPPISRVQQAIQLMVRSRGQISIDVLCTTFGMSTRHFRRQFVEVTGVSPKQLARIIRFRNTVSLLQRTSSLDWAQAAVDSGYYDQSHMIRDFHEFAQVTPAVLQK